MGRRVQNGRSVIERVRGDQQERLATLHRAAPESAVRGRPQGSQEKVIRRQGRPVILVQDDTFVPEGSSALSKALTASKPTLERALLAVGRVEVDANGRSAHIGTAWLVAPGIAVTNRHVALVFAHYGPGGTFPMRNDVIGRPYLARVDFKEEHQRVAESAFKVRAVRYIAPDDDTSPDLAVIELAPNDSDGNPLPAPLALAAQDPEVDLLVAAIGYPAFDPEETDQAAMRDYFGHAYGVKRLCPGAVIAPRGAVANWSFAHDCTTLGGSSGSALVDLADGAVVGLHFGGVSGLANYAVRVSVIAAYLQQIGVAATTAAPEETVGDENVSPEVVAERARNSVHAPSYFNGRGGFDREFLGEALELPSPLPAVRDEAAKTGDGGIELAYTHFSVIQRATRRLPWITAVNIDGRQINRIQGRPGWSRDGRIAADAQAGDEIYTNSGFSRGHMVRRLDPCWGSEAEVKQANLDTFHFTNACPQEQDGFNDALWGDLEDYILNNADADDIKVNVYTGPHFEDDDPFVRDLAIPLKFWKVVAWKVGGALRAVGFVLSQEPFIDIEFTGSKYRTSERSLKSIAAAGQFAWDPKLLDADVNKNVVNEGASRALRSLRALDRHFAR
jgi:endonuclease G, mitochondrial